MFPTQLQEVPVVRRGARLEIAEPDCQGGWANASWGRGPEVGQITAALTGIGPHSARRPTMASTPLRIAGICERRPDLCAG